MLPRKVASGNSTVAAHIRAESGFTSLEAS
jgi:hypothetical protein